MHAKDLHDLMTQIAELAMAEAETEDQCYDLICESADNAVSYYSTQRKIVFCYLNDRSAFGFDVEDYYSVDDLGVNDLDAVVGSVAYEVVRIGAMLRVDELRPACEDCYEPCDFPIPANFVCEGCSE